MNTSNHLERLSRQLWGLASFGQLANVLLWLGFGALLLHYAGKTQVSYGMSLAIDGQRVAADALVLEGGWLKYATAAYAAYGQHAVWLLWLGTLPIYFGQFWILSRLQRLARSLWDGNPLSSTTADCFRGLGRALLLYFGLRVVGPLLVLFPFSGRQAVPVGIDLSLGYAALIGWIGLSVVATLMHEAVRLAEENREFV